MDEITKNAIVSAFKELASEKYISDITIVEITEKCGLKRQTFYNHFKDKYDLIKWLYTNEVISKLNTDKDHWEDNFKDIFKYFIDNKDMVINIYNSENQHYILNFIIRQSQPLVRNVVEEKTKNMEVNNFDRDFLTLFFTGSLGAVLRNWIDMGMPDMVDEIVEKTFQILNGSIKNYLNNN